MNKIKYIDGFRLHHALTAGVRNVVSRQEYLNKINVFPVPDGDTGTNMAFTLTYILNEIEKKYFKDIDKMLEAIANASLDGARGNSGVILAQFFQGVSDGAKGKAYLSPDSFSIAIQRGAQSARVALNEPREGTILTVITDFSNKIIQSIESNNLDFKDIINEGYQAANFSLQNTPKLLPILKKSGVVDAGGQGFVDLIEGIIDFINKGDLKSNNDSIDKNNLIINDIDYAINTKESKFRYCTECIINGDNINDKKIRSVLKELGDSLVLAGNNKKTKVHIHVNDPSKVFNLCRVFGSVNNEKADDMWKQQKVVSRDKSHSVAIVTDSGADISNTIDPIIHIVPVRYNFGPSDYIDKLSQTSTEFYNELSKNPIHPQTSQPTPGDFLRQYEYLASHYESIISIHIPNKLSGTYQSALNASKKIKNKKISVFDGLSASVGLGLIVKQVANLANEGYSHQKIINSIDKIISSTKIFLYLDNIDYIIRGGRLPKWIKKITQIFNISPILTTKKNGSMGLASILRKNQQTHLIFSKFIIKKINKNKLYNISIGHCNSIKNAELIKKDIMNRHNKINKIEIMDIGCALGVHAGPGSLAISMQEV
tara:strand:- start:1154 stop:2950 length:1797 start_codon:yes stop_codon:yes gene_type:complete